ncbi:MAG: FkbM family methyltransferase [Leptolyngbya sp. BL-A-14]
MSAQSSKAFSTLIQTVKPTVFWEVGKAIGAYSWLALEHSRTCKAILFEADPENYAALLKTIDSKQWHRAHAQNIVVSPISAKAGEGDVCAKPGAEVVGTVPGGVPFEPKSIPSMAIKRGFYGLERNAIETLTLDELLASGYASPDIIKIDTTAAERLIIEGARTVLETCSPVLIVKAASHELICYLTSMSYRSFAFDQDNTIFISVYF